MGNKNGVALSGPGSLNEQISPSEQAQTLKPVIKV